MNTSTLVSLLIIILVLISCTKTQPEVYITSNGALDGYDPVAYFQDSIPVKGKEPFTCDWNGAQWFFSSRENLQMFRNDPTRYAPQYGGYCAFGMSNGYKASTQPDAWTIADGKLYLNYNRDVRNDWMKDQQNLIRKADDNWPTVRGM